MEIRCKHPQSPFYFISSVHFVNQPHFRSLTMLLYLLDNHMPHSNILGFFLDFLGWSCAYPGSPTDSSSGASCNLYRHSLYSTWSDSGSAETAGGGNKIGARQCSHPPQHGLCEKYFTPHANRLQCYSLSSCEPWFVNAE